MKYRGGERRDLELMVCVVFVLLESELPPKIKTISSTEVDC